MDAETRKLLLYAGLGIGAYFLLKSQLDKLAHTVSDATTKAGEVIGSTAADLLLPDVNPNSPLIEVEFPSGNHHLVDTQTVTHTFFGPDVFVVPMVDWAHAEGVAGSTLKLLQYAPGSYYARP